MLIERRRELHLASLDGIRGISFLLVFFSHALPGSHSPGQFGVTVFFFLSGLLITTLLRAERERTGSNHLGRFYVRRALRILPPFYLVLALATVAAQHGLLPGSFDRGALTAIACHAANFHAIGHGWTGMPAGTAAYWSLAVEEHFYLLFPGLYLLTASRLRSGRAQALLFLALCGAVLAWRCALVFALDAQPVRTFVGTDTRIDSILFGCALAVYGNPALDRTRLSRRAWLQVLLPLGLVTLAVCFALGGHLGLRESVRYSLQGIALMPVFVAAVRYPDAPLFRPLNWAPVRHLGTLSYSLYLLHGVVINAFAQTTLSVPVRVACEMALSIAAAQTICWLIERPCARLRARLSTEEAVPADFAGGLAPTP